MHRFLPLIVGIAHTGCWVPHCEVFPEHCVAMEISAGESATGETATGESVTGESATGESASDTSTSESSTDTTSGGGFCGDGVVDPGEECDDQDISNSDGCLSNCQTARSCKHIRDSFPIEGSGVYRIDPDGPEGPESSQSVLCDMDTDSGGWTLVASSQAALDDAGGGYHVDLVTINPAAGHLAVWDGMRPRIVDRADIRFTCLTDPGGSLFNVDLSFYDIGWYREITTGDDADSCFSESDGAGDDQPTPARRNNLTGVALEAGDLWNAGFLEGEDTCADTSDFTVDFDDRGKDSNESDGTDWGEDDGILKCGSSNLSSGAWHIWVREIE